MTPSTKTYEAVITKNDYGLLEDDETNIFYDAKSVASKDSIVLTQKAPFRRMIATGGTPFKIRAAPLNSPCRIAFVNGNYMLIDVLEQYVIEECTGGV